MTLRARWRRCSASPACLESSGGYRGRRRQALSGRLLCASAKAERPRHQLQARLHRFLQRCQPDGHRCKGVRGQQGRRPDRHGAGRRRGHRRRPDSRACNESRNAVVAGGPGTGGRGLRARSTSRRHVLEPIFTAINGGKLGGPSRTLTLKNAVEKKCPADAGGFALLADVEAAAPPLIEGISDGTVTVPQ